MNGRHECGRFPSAVRHGVRRVARRVGLLPAHTPRHAGRDGDALPEPDVFRVAAPGWPPSLPVGHPGVWPDGESLAVREECDRVSGSLAEAVAS